MSDKLNENKLNGVSGGKGNLTPNFLANTQCTVFQCRACHTMNGHAADCSYNPNDTGCDICEWPGSINCPKKLGSAGEL